MLKIITSKGQGKFQWLKSPSELNGNNLNNARREASRQFCNKTKKNVKEKIKEFATNSKDKNIRDMYRGISKFKRCYQPRSNLLKDENGDLLADSLDILYR
jgi:hypothetical protein